MSQTDSGHSGTSSQGLHDTPEKCVEHKDATASQVPTLAKLCTALLLKSMRLKVLDTVLANLHEEAELGIVNVDFMCLTCTDLRKAFSTKHLIQVVLGIESFAQVCAGQAHETHIDDTIGAPR